MKNRFAPVLLLCASLLAGPALAQASGRVAVPHRDFAGVPAIDAAALSGMPGARAVWYPVSETMLLRVEGDPSVEIRFNAGVPFATVKGATIPLPLAPQREGGAFWVPRIPVVQALDSLLPGEYSWNAQTGELVWAPEKDLVGMSVAPSDAGTAVELRFTRKVKWEKLFTRPTFVLRFDDVALPVDTLPRKFTTGQIRNIGAIQEPKSAQLSFEVNHLVGDVTVEPRDEGRTLVVFFHRPGEAKKESPAPAPAAATRPDKLKTIIIDPGHGGKDSGAIGLKAKEKDVTLAVGKKLKAELEKRGYVAKMTRSDDTFITLKQRPELASKWKGDLFVSIHCDAIAGDAARKAQTKGFKAFILREAESEEDKAIARRENKFIDESSESGAKRELSPVEWILLEHQLNLYSKESEHFADALVQSMGKTEIAKNGSGAGQAGFYVLVGAFMPAVLLELGFISNPADEKYLASPRGQDEIAARIADGIDLYRAK